ncbi:MAG: 4Fe-4S dicluster domain-containing protein [Theionarchaea archaeon]|nr:MAG: hypothetical protein AYK18_12345 [Theionarchaea archaeon DG-70]MBU7010553.1 4Fe-4S dicluster domain-containing protein [Theionarchaea archaeon]
MRESGNDENGVGNMTRVQVSTEKSCVGCYLCVLWCSAHHEQVSSRAASRITLTWNHQQLLPTPFLCQQCDNPPCVAACPNDALHKKGYIQMDADACSGCGACEAACPYNAIHVYKGKAVVCDLCEGSPICVKVCPVDMLEVVQ